LVSSPYNFWLARLVERNSCFAYLACTRRTEEGMIQGFLDVSYSFQKFIEHKNLKKKVFGFVRQDISAILKKENFFFPKITSDFFMSPRMNE
jgi:hypothetical protein